jgi:hypothetical protein
MVSSVAATTRCGARTRASFGWVKPFGVAPYIGICHPASRDRCRFSIYMFSIWIRNRFVGDKKKQDFFRVATRAPFRLCSS